jgi:hypothetical protein
LILSLFEDAERAGATPGDRVVYDIARNEAHFGDAEVDGPVLVWVLSRDGAEGAALSAEIDLDASVAWMVRCDRIDFPPGGVAYRHTHPGAGIRRLLFGSIRIEGPGGHVADHGPGGAWFEGFDYPVLATASTDEPTAFVRVMLLPAGWEGKRTIRYVDPADEDKPKLQRPSVFFDRPLDL